MAEQRGALTGLRAGILTCSTSRTIASDGSGDALVAGVVAAGGVVALRAVVPDDRARIGSTLAAWADGGRVDVILTTGGTGFSPRDVTPEATADACDRPAPGLAELVRLRGLEQTPRAALSRASAALRGPVLVINLPGSPAGASAGLSAVAPLLGHAVAMARGGGHG